MRKGKKFGKKVARGVVAATLMLSVLGTTTNVAQAKTYYSMKYGKWNAGKPWKASSRKAYENDVRAGLGITTFNSRLSDTKRYDCDGDGKKKYTSVTKITYEKYKIEDGSLSSKGKDTYYGIGPSYD